MADTSLRDDFNSTYMNRNNNQWGVDLPAQLQLSKHIESLKAAYSELNKLNLSNEEKISALKRIDAEREKNFSKLNFRERQQLLKQQEENRKREEKHLQTLRETYESIKETNKDKALDLQKQIEDIEQALKDSKKKTVSDLKKERKNIDKNSPEYQQLTQQIKDLGKQNTKDTAEKTGESIADHFTQKLGVKRYNEDNEKISKSEQLLQAVTAGIANLAKLADEWFKKAEQAYTTYNSKITARLEGSGKTYSDLNKTIRQNLSMSTIAKQTDVLENLAKLVDSGIAYNLEQRSFLATVKDDVAKTFDAFNSNLSQMIRLQREDSSLARLGLESSLQTFFNENFLDTAYLSDLRNAVSGALIDVESTMVNEEAAQFEYIVQKWLGSLYSVGASSNLINQIASGLNMLGTGNVQGLSGSPTQTLFAMAANRSGQSYSQLLTGGLNADNTNKLLRSMVEYLSEIADSTKDNKVVAGAYNTIFNMSQADMRALRNITNNIESISENSISYNQMQSRAATSITNLGSRYTLPKKIENALENLKFGAAANIIEDPFLYSTLLATNAIESLTGGIEINLRTPLVGTSFKITDVIKDAMFGISFLSEALNGIGNFKENKAGIGSAFLSTNPGQMRGTGYNLEETSGLSQSYNAGGSTNDIQNQNLSAATKKQDEIKNAVGEDLGGEITVEDIFNGLFFDKSNQGQLTTLSESNAELLRIISSSYSEESKAQRVIISGFNFDTNGAFEMPVKLGPVGSEQIKGGFNSATDSIKGGEEGTLYALLSIILEALAENGALNVNLASSSLPLTDLVTGRGTPESTGSTRTLPPGNGATSPIGASSGGIMRDSSRNTMVAI